MQDSRFKSLLTGQDLPSPQTADIQGMDPEFRIEYIDSTGSFVIELESAALRLEGGTDAEESRAVIRRVLHSIKGESGIVGMRDVYDLCHEAESAFEQTTDNVRAGDMVLKVKDWIQAVIELLMSPERSGQDESMHEQSESPVRLRALIVDDSRIAIKRIKGLIGNFFDCDCACDGRQCLDAYRKSLDEGAAYSLITLDINMPEMNGHQTLVAVRELEAERGIKGLDGVKIIMTTTESGSSHIFPAFNEGCEAYVTKTRIGEKLLDEIARIGLMDSSTQTDCIAK